MKKAMENEIKEKWMLDLLDRIKKIEDRLTKLEESNRLFMARQKPLRRSIIVGERNAEMPLLSEITDFGK